MRKIRITMIFTVLLICIIAILALTTVTTQATRVRPTQTLLGENLVANPGFEGIGLPVDNDLPNYDNWTRDTFNNTTYGEIFTPEGWVTWWQEGDFKRPECKVIPNEAPFNYDPPRVYQGYYSAMCFSFYGMINAGQYQVVTDLKPGSIVEAEFIAHAWSCSESGDAYSCGDTDAFYFRVGIDPLGGTDPFTDTIVWSEPHYIYDYYDLVGPVTAEVGPEGKVTMFTQAYGKYPNKHNDGYFDNPSLSIFLHKIYIPISNLSP